jgi:WD40 repeat protein
VAKVEGHKRQMGVIAFASNDTLLTAAADGRVAGWSLPKGEPQFSFAGNGIVEALVAVPGTSFVVAGSLNGDVTVWRTDTNAQHATLGEGQVCSLAATSNGGIIAARDSRVEVWNVATKQLVASADLSPLGDTPRSVCAAPDGRLLCVGTNAGTVLVFETRA